MSVRQPLGVVRDHHAVEFSDGDSVVEDHPGARLRQHGRLQAGHADAAVGAELRQDPRRSRRSRGVVNLVTGGGGEVGDADARPTTTCASCRSPDRPTSAASCPRRRRRRSRRSTSRWAARTSSWSWTTRTSSSRSKAACGAGSARPGQRCTAASRVVVHEKVYRPFLDRFVARARALRVGDGLDPESQMGPLVSAGQRETVMRYVEIGTSRRARRSPCGGHALTDGAHAKGFFHEPTIFADVAPAMRIAQEEIFGPVVSVMPCRSLDEAVAIGNGVQYGLSASIYTQDVNRAFSAMRDRRHRHLLRQRADHRRRGPPAVRRHEGHRQRPPRGRHGGARRVLRVEVGLRRLQRQAPACTNRHGRHPIVRHRHHSQATGSEWMSPPKPVKVLRTVGDVFGREIVLETLPWSADYYLATGITIPADGYAMLRNQFDAIFIGALGDPRVPDKPSRPRHSAGHPLRAGSLRQLSSGDTASRAAVPAEEARRRRMWNFVVFRENTEGSYVGIGGRFRAPAPRTKSAIQEEVNTYKGVSGSSGTPSAAARARPHARASAWPTRATRWRRARAVAARVSRGPDAVSRHRGATLSTSTRSRC